jgi:hypothetical protein
MESSLIRMVAVPLIAGRIRPCLPELRSDERTSLPLTPIDASPPAGLTLDDDRRSFSRTRQATEPFLRLQKRRNCRRSPPSPPIVRFTTDTLPKPRRISVNVSVALQVGGCGTTD